MKNGCRTLGKISAAIVLVTVLLAGSALAAAPNAPRVEPHPQAVPSAVSLGVVTIYANGTLSNLSAPISVSGSSYTLTASFNGELRDLASDVTLNGAGFDVNYTVGMSGGDNVSVDVANASQVVVKNFHATNGTGGIYLYNVTGATVSGNSLSYLNRSVTVTNSSNIDVTDNGLNFTRVAGVFAVYSSALDIAQNWAVGNGSKAQGYAIETEDSSYLTLENNQCNGSLLGIEASYGHDVWISGNNLSNTEDGAGLYYAQDSTITENVAFNSTYGSWAESDTNVTISDNREVSNYNPLYDYQDDGAVFSDNYAPLNGDGGEGVYSYQSSNVVFEGNDLANSTGYGAYVYESAGVSLIDNNLANATSDGVYAYETYGSLWVVGDQIAEPANGSHTPDGIYSYYSYGSVYVANTTLDNLTYGVYLEGTYGPTTLVNDSITNSPDAAVVAYYAYGTITVSGSNLSNSPYGIEDYYAYSGGLTVSNCVIKGTYTGVYDDSGYYGMSPLTVVGSTITNATYGVETYEMEGAISIVGNDITNATYAAVYVEYGDYQPTTISNNDLSNSSSEGVYVYEGIDVSIVGNVAHNDSYAAIYVEDSYGLTTIAGNQVQDSPGYGIYAYYEYGPTTIAGNNVSNSYEGLYLDYLDSLTTVTGNDATNSSYVYFYSSYLLNVSGNNFLRDGLLQIDADTLGLFFHNDINSSSFSAASDSLEGSWNAPYPVGGNYWTGYGGPDAYSGPSQNVPGSDGIGDTPYTLDGQVDQYPLMQPWTNPVVTFIATGLPASAAWSVTFNGVTESSVSNGLVVFGQVNGAYSAYAYTVHAPAGQMATPSSGSGTLQARDLTIQLHFTIAGYALVANETGLAAGTQWGIDVNGLWTNGTGSSLSTVLANGTYSYSFAAVHGYATPAGGTITVQGHAVSVTAAYAPAHVTVTFVESGLPSGASWSVSLAGGSPVSSSTTTIAITAAVGTSPSFTITGPSGYVLTPSTGTLGPLTANASVYVVATSSSSATSTGSSGANVSSNLFYGVVAGLVIALILAALGWAMYARRRPPAPAVLPPSPPAPPAGVKAWDESAAGAGSPPPAAPGTPPAPPPGAH